jgi:hypothetical protein
LIVGAGQPAALLGIGFIKEPRLVATYLAWHAWAEIQGQARDWNFSLRSRWIACRNAHAIAFANIGELFGRLFVISKKG